MVGKGDLKMVRRRSLISLGVVAALAAASWLATASSPPRRPSRRRSRTARRRRAYVPPKTSDGQPDICRAIWTNSTYIPLQRPEGVTKEFYTPEEMDKMEAAAKAREDEQTVPGTQQDVHYDDGQFGLARSQVDLRAEPAHGADRGSARRKNPSTDRRSGRSGTTRSPRRGRWARPRPALRPET